MKFYILYLRTLLFIFFDTVIIFKFFFLKLLDLLLGTLIREVSSDPDAHKVISRFVRSVVRIFAVLNVAMAPSCSRKKG